MTTVELNNKNKTKINFSYDHGLPYKKSIRPDMEYGDWTQNEDITLISVFFSKDELNLLTKNKINCLEVNLIKNEFWFDLEDIYLVLESSKYLKDRISSKKFIMVFFDNNRQQINAWKFI